MWPFNRKKPNNVNHDFNDEDRDFSAQIRKVHSQIKLREAEMRLKEAEARLKETEMRLADYDSEDDIEPETDDPMTMIMAAMLPKLMQGQQQPVQMQTQPIQETKVEWTDEQIDNVLKQIPSKYLKMAKKMDDETIKQYIRTQYPYLGNDTLERAIARVRA